MNSFKKLLFSALALTGMLVALHVTPFGKSVEDLLRRGYVWVAYIGYTARVKAVHVPPQETTDMQQLRAEVTRLQQEHALLLELLNFKKDSQFTMIGALVRGRSHDPSRAYVLIDHGQTDSIMAGSPVVTRNGVLVGVISEVYKNNSLVRLLTDPGSRIAGRLLNQSQTEGVVVGGHGIVVRMEFVPRSEKIDVGTQLVTSGLDEQIPRGLLIGNVINVEEDTNTLFARVIIETPLDYSTIQFVQIVVSP